ncbi:MAG TPA: DUF2141 domain-containing protein [Acidisarcina sp.]
MLRPFAFAGVLAPMVRALALGWFALLTTASCPALDTRAAGAGPSQAACTLVVHVEGVRNQRGVVGGALFTSSSGWPEDGSRAFAQVSSPTKGSTATLAFSHLPQGRYGVVVLHDENQNKKLDRNMFGVPKEGFGFANNPRVMLSAPSIDKATLNVSCPSTETTIRLIYK